MRRWAQEVFPVLGEQAKSEHTQIWFEDEAKVHSDAHAGTTCAPRDGIPVVSNASARFGIYFFSAVN